MEETRAAVQLAALAHPTRVALVRLLATHAPSGLAAGAIASALEVAPSSLSFHVHELEAARLIRRTRVGRNVFYALEVAELRGLIAFLTETCCGGRVDLCGEGFAATTRQEHCPMAENNTGGNPIYTVLFLCTGNSSRSIMAEAILNREGAGRFKAYSAGSRPTGAVDPQTLDLLARLNHPVEGLRSKSWDEFVGPGAPELDFVFTVCDDAAGEVCPTWPGQPMTAHWGVPDPAKFEGNAAQRGQFVADVYRMLFNRISVFISLPLQSHDRLALQTRLDSIGRMPRSADAAAPAAPTAA